MDLQHHLQTLLQSDYTIERELGGGGMSRVFLATEHKLGRRVVIKVLSSELSATLSTERFAREIQLAASLQQANIVPVLTAGTADGMPYFTMPFVEGESLRARLARGPMSETEAVTVLRDVTRALIYAHERGIVHRDIKPDNILLSGESAVVTDFGIAKAISAARGGTGDAADSSTMTQVGTSLGTPAYIAPEQAAGDPGTDHRADLYALGCVAFELLTGQPPFHGRELHQLLRAHMTEVAPTVRSRVATVSPPLDALVTQCLDRNVDETLASQQDISRQKHGSKLGADSQNALRHAATHVGKGLRLVAEEAEDPESGGCESARNEMYALLKLRHHLERAHTFLEEAVEFVCQLTTAIERSAEELRVENA